MSFIEKKLKTNEELIAVIHKHWCTFSIPALITAIIFFLDFFFIFPLFSWGKPGQIIFAFFLAVGLFMILRLLVKMKYNLTIITNERIIRVIQKGIFHRLVTEIDIMSIIEALYRVKGVWQIMFRYGTIMLRIKDKKKPFIIKYVYQPSKVQQLILNIQKMERLSDN